MNPNEILTITREGLSVVLWVSLPIVLVATITALIVAVGQTVTQLQDQSIGQSLRQIAVMVVIVLAAGVLSRQVLRFAERAFQSLGMLP